MTDVRTVWKKPLRTSIVLTVLFLLLLLGAGGVSAAQTNESLGPGGYGWQQAYSTNGSGYAWARMTTSADRDFYDYGFKPINVYMRLETYWSQDCGWWYITGGEIMRVLVSNSTNTFNSTTTPATSVASKGVRNLTYNWDSLSTAAPGRWNVTAYENVNRNHTLTFYIYVRGQLNVTSITNSSNQAGSLVTINATLTDHTGRLINQSHTDNAAQSAAPTVTAYVTGAGEDFVLTMSDSDNDGIWGATFTPQRPGDHKVIIMAGDSHQYWVDGRGSTMLTMTGNFPYASLGLPLLERIFGGLGNFVGFRSVASMLAVLSGFGVVNWRRKRG